MEKKTLAKKLLEFQNSVETIKKDGKNEFFKKPNGKASTYATLPNILSAVKPILNALQIVVNQPMFEGKVYTILTDTETGESERSCIDLPTNLNAQQIGSAITYFRRYTLVGLLALEIDEDDDGNAASNPPPEVKSTANDKPWLNKFEKDKVTLTEAWETATKMVKAGQVLIPKIEEKYKLSKELKEELKKLVPNAAGQ